MKLDLQQIELVTFPTSVPVKVVLGLVVRVPHGGPVELVVEAERRAAVAGALPVHRSKHVLLWWKSYVLVSPFVFFS